MRRLVVSLLVVVLGASFGAGWALDKLFVRFDSSLTDSETAPLANWRTLGRSLADVIGQSRNPSAVVADLERMSGAEPGTGIELVDSASLALDGEAGAALEATLAGPLGLALETDAGVRVYYALDDRNDLLALAYPHESEASSLIRLLLTLAFYTALLLLVVIWLLPLLRRLSRLTAGANAFGKGELSKRVPTSSHSELYQLESTFNAMASRIENLVDDNRLLSRGVSHDLRTPLARLRFGIDSLAELDTGTPDFEQRRAAQLTRLEDDIAAMEQLLHVMLDYARFDARLDRVPLAPVDVESIVSVSIERVRHTSGASIEYIHDAALPCIDGLEGPLGMLVDNLLENARRYGRARIRVSLLANAGGGLQFSVEDDGDGIAPADRAAVTRAFVKADAPWPPSAGDDSGYGLGLAIVTRIADWHRATFAIGTSAALGGALVDVRFPKGFGTCNTTAS